MRRRDTFIALGGAAIGWPLTARAAQSAATVGFVSSRSPGKSASLVTAFRQGLSESGYLDGRNVVLEYRWAEGHYDRLPELAADLVARKVGVIAAVGGPNSAQAAKRATSTIPIVFATGTDPRRDRIGRQPCPTGRQRHRFHDHERRTDSQAARAAFGAGPRGQERCLAGQPEKSERRAHDPGNAGKRAQRKRCSWKS